MAENYTMLSDTLGSSEGMGYITRDGQNRRMFDLSKVEAYVDLKVTEKQLMGHRMVQHKEALHFIS